MVRCWLWFSVWHVFGKNNACVEHLRFHEFHGVSRAFGTPDALSSTNRDWEDEEAEFIYKAPI